MEKTRFARAGSASIERNEQTASRSGLYNVRQFGLSRNAAFTALDARMFELPYEVKKFFSVAGHRDPLA